MADQELARAVKPTLLTDCCGVLPVGTPHASLRFSQFFVCPAPPGSGLRQKYLALQKAQLTFESTTIDDIIDRLTDALMKRWEDHFDGITRASGPPRRTPRRPKKPDPDPRPKLPAFLNLQPPTTKKQLAALRAKIDSRMRAKLVPASFVPWNDKRPLIGLHATFVQDWRLEGYTRGELVSSISLAPGEQVVLEYHTWDKSTFKSEQELTEELEQRLSSKLTQRDSQDIVGELATQTGTKLNGNLNLQIPIPLGDVTLPLGVDVGGDLTQQLDTKVTETFQSVTERTEEAATTLKNQRKVRVEVARDVGRESKQTRTIANTNRCHTLNCHYFEILSHYTLLTRPVQLAPCVLVDFPDATITPAWVLCHEGVLRRVLIDPIYLAGFEAAKVLEVADVLDQLTKGANEGGGAQDEGAVAGQDHEFEGLRAAILASWDELRDAFDDVKPFFDDLLDIGFDDAGGALARLFAADDGADDEEVVRSMPKALYLALLTANKDAHNALKALEDTADSTGALEALRRFFSAVTHRDYQYSVAKAVVAEGLDALGLPPEVVDFLLFAANLLYPILGVMSIVEYTADDAGLHVAVKAAEDRVRAATAGRRGAITSPATGAGAVLRGDLVGRLNTQAGGISPQKRAEATVEYERLKCHLTDHKTHYLQAVWLRTDPDERARFLAERGLATLTTGELLGFVGDKAAYTLTDPNPFKHTPDVRKTLAKILGGIKPPQPFEIQLPTGGTQLEAVLGCCDSCEKFIGDSRDIELRANAARAAQDEAEAERRKARLAATPPDLTEFVSPPGGSLKIDVSGTPSGDGA
jgi:hypothetical protein